MWRHTIESYETRWTSNNATDWLRGAYCQLFAQVSRHVVDDKNLDPVLD